MSMAHILDRLPDLPLAAVHLYPHQLPAALYLDGEPLATADDLAALDEARSIATGDTRARLYALMIRLQPLATAR